MDCSVTSPRGVFLRVRLIGVAGLLVCLGVAPAVSHGADVLSNDALRASIVALDHARETAVGELDSPTLTDRERSDYRDFIVYLNTRIVGYCRQLLAQGATELVASLPCPTAEMLSAAGETGALVPAAVVPSQPRPLTRDEQTAGLHESFVQSLGAFDQMLLEEEARVATRVPRQREQGGSDGGSAEAGGGAAAGAGEENGMAGSGGETAGMTGTTGEAASGATDPSARGAGTGEVSASAPQGLPDGTLPPPEDDDIVARQLREAAEKETDPELKKKLWEEYWKYKKGTGR